MGQFYLGIDQSTQGTKAVLFDEAGQLVCRCDRAHRQLVSGQGWVSHDLEEIWAATCGAVSDAIGKAGISAGEIAGVGISNQRETSAAFDRATGRPFCDAVVWQCSRAESVCRALEEKNPGLAALVRRHTGLNLSPYFPAAKFAWMLQNVPEAETAQREGRLALGTIDSWLVYKLTDGKVFRTDYSNASRTQLFDIVRLRWDEELCHLFGVEPESLPEVTDSDACFGETDFDGLLPRKVPIHGVLGDCLRAVCGHVADTNAKLLGHGDVDPFRVIPLVGQNESDQLLDHAIGNTLWRSLRDLVPHSLWQRVFLHPQRPRRQRFGDHIIKADDPCPFGIGGVQRHLKLFHMLFPFLCKAVGHAVTALQRLLFHIIRMGFHKGDHVFDMPIEPALSVSGH